MCWGPVVTTAMAAHHGNLAPTGSQNRTPPLAATARSHLHGNNLYKAGCDNRIMHQEICPWSWWAAPMASDAGHVHAAGGAVSL